MYNIIADVHFDKAAAKAKICARMNDALTQTGAQALKDTNLYVPIQGGDSKNGGGGSLRDSAITHSDTTAKDLTYTLRWDTPYAQYLFHGEVMYGSPTDRRYGPEKLRFTAALARMEWTNYAYKVYGDKWEMMCQKIFEKGGRG